MSGTHEPPSIDVSGSIEAGGSESLLFDAVLYPHRSLPPRGFAILMILVASVSFAAGLAFLLMGAWPVMGFFGLDVLLIYVAFRMNYRAGRTRETVRMSRAELSIQRHLPSGKMLSWSFQPYWLRVEMDDPPGDRSELALTSHGRRLVIGAFLSPAERLEVARALRAALAREGPVHGGAARGDAAPQSAARGL